MEYVLSLSYGKDSLACLGAIQHLGLPLNRIVHAEVWATDTIPADPPPMMEFKAKADAIIKRKYGIEVEHISSGKTYEECFYKVITGQRCGNQNRIGKIRGWPYLKGPWCNRDLKMDALRRAQRKADIVYIGIAVDEPERFHNLTDVKRSPLVEAGWTEADCMKWCKSNNLLSPIYQTSTRSGCWFCHNQGVEQLRLLRRMYPEYWRLMMKWDSDSMTTFKAGSGPYPGHTVHDFDKRFCAEEAGKVPSDRKFRWKMLDCLEDDKN